MIITIAIDTGNAAFEDDKLAEVERIIRELSWGRVLSGGTIKCYDYNGNAVGSVTVESAEDDDEEDEKEEPCDECGGTEADETAHESWCSRHPDHDGG